MNKKLLYITLAAILSISVFYLGYKFKFLVADDSDVLLKKLKESNQQTKPLEISIKDVTITPPVQYQKFQPINQTPSIKDYTHGHWGKICIAGQDANFSNKTTYSAIFFADRGNCKEGMGFIEVWVKDK